MSQTSQLLKVPYLLTQHKVMYHLPQPFLSVVPYPAHFPFGPNVPNVSSVPFPQNSPPAHSPQSDVSSDAAVSIPDPPSVPNIPNVSNVSSVSNSAHSTSEVAQQPAETAPASLESSPKGNGTS